MRILAIETTDKTGSVALLEGRRVVAEIRLDPDQRSAQSLAPAIKRILETQGWRPAEVRLLAVAIGPGSFTGLRVGVTTAKALAYALEVDVLGVNTLEVIAAQTPAEIVSLAVVLDAQRQQVFAARFARGTNEIPVCLAPTAILDNDAWLAGLESSIAVSGPGLVKLQERLPAGVTVIAAEHWNPRAATVGRLALAHYEAGRRDDLWQLVPHYFRRSAAEEKAEAQDRGSGRPH